MMTVQQITRGDDWPDILFTIGDSRADADFSTLDPSAVRIQGELDGVVVVDDNPDTVDAAPDNKSAVLKRAWEAGETDVAGVMWFTAEVEWTSGKTQTFPRTGAIPLHINRRPGDA
jgi:hypothetical protein